MTQQSSIQGHAPTLTVRPIEREIYRRLWETDEYRRLAPGEQYVMEFLEQAQPPRGATVLDLGCGTGRGGAMLATTAGLDVTLTDFADNCLDPFVRDIILSGQVPLRFELADLCKSLPVVGLYGYCCDVLEHIPPASVMRCLSNCLLAAKTCYFRISTTEDAFGALVGHPLHLSVHPYAWWLERFAELDGKVLWSRNDGDSVAFLVSAWSDGQDVVDAGVLNTTVESVRENVRHNIAQGWQQVAPCQAQDDVEVMILGGGPSLAQFEEEIREQRAAGVKLVTLNGAYNWCIERGLIPSATVIVDAREFNARFVEPVVDECKYLIASQCHPSVLEGLPFDRTFLWHTTADSIEDLLNAQYEIWFGIPGGSTVLLRAIPLLRMLGFRRFHLYGCDSCLSEGEHHAFAQRENDSNIVIPVEVAGRIFYCHPWMCSQGQEFVSLIKAMGDAIDLQIHGDGLLSHIIEAGAALAAREE